LFPGDQKVVGSGADAKLKQEFEKFAGGKK
jgi:hypothetical protein